MCGKNIISRNGEKLYLATFEFVSGEYCQPFVKLFYANDEKDLEEQIHEYLIDYYGIRNTSEVNANVYYYWNGEIAVRHSSWEEINNTRQIINRLLW
jgi:hypothetical protein